MKTDAGRRTSASGAPSARLASLVLGLQYAFDRDDGPHSPKRLKSRHPGIATTRSAATHAMEVTRGTINSS
jgi:hypothetical protein